MAGKKSDFEVEQEIARLIEELVGEVCAALMVVIGAWDSPELIKDATADNGDTKAVIGDFMSFMAGAIFTSEVKFTMRVKKLRGEQRANVHVEAEIGKRGGNHLLSAVVPVLTHFGDQDARPVAGRFDCGAPEIFFSPQDAVPLRIDRHRE